MYAVTEHIKCSVNVHQDKLLISLLKSTVSLLIFCLLIVLLVNERRLLNPLTIIMYLPISPSSSTREVSSVVILFAWKSTSVQCVAKRVGPPSFSSGPLKMRVKFIANVSPGCWMPLYRKHKISWEHIEGAPIQLKKLSNVYCDYNWEERHSLEKERTLWTKFKWRKEEEGRYITGGNTEACGVTEAQGEDC